MTVFVKVKETERKSEPVENPFLKGKLMREKGTEFGYRRVVLIQKVRTPDSSQEHYRGAVLNAFDASEWNSPLSWWLEASTPDQDQNSLAWIEKYYEPFYGEITIKVNQD